MRRHFKTMCNIWMLLKFSRVLRTIFVLLRLEISLHSTRSFAQSLKIAFHEHFHHFPFIRLGFMCVDVGLYAVALREFIYIRIKQIFQLQHLFIILTSMYVEQRAKKHARQHRMTFLSRLFQFFRGLSFSSSLLHNFCSQRSRESLLSSYLFSWFMPIVSNKILKNQGWKHWWEKESFWVE